MSCRVHQDRRIVVTGNEYLKAGVALDLGHSKSGWLVSADRKYRSRG